MPQDPFTQNQPSNSQDKVTKNPNKKIVIIIIIVFILATICIVSFLIYKNFRKPPLSDNQNINNSNAHLNIDSNTNQAVNTNTILLSPLDTENCPKIQDRQEQQNCQKVGYYIWSKHITSSAIKEKDVSKCQLLIDKAAADSCIMTIAQQNGDESSCELVTDKESCLYSVYSNKDTLASCLNLTKSIEQENCLRSVISGNYSEDFCQKQGDENLKQRCLDLYYSIKASRSMDYDLCQKVSTEEGRQKCLKGLPPDSDGDKLSDFAEENQLFTDPKNPDSDADGLDDGQEVLIYRTDPKNPDSDADGYPDGTEVNAGYNPLGY